MEKVTFLIWREPKDVEKKHVHTVHNIFGDKFNLPVLPYDALRTRMNSPSDENTLGNHHGGAPAPPNPGPSPHPEPTEMGAKPTNDHESENSAGPDADKMQEDEPTEYVEVEINGATQRMTKEAANELTLKGEAREPRTKLGTNNVPPRRNYTTEIRHR